METLDNKKLLVCARASGVGGCGEAECQSRPEKFTPPLPLPRPPPPWSLRGNILIYFRRAVINYFRRAVKVPSGAAPGA